MSPLTVSFLGGAVSFIPTLPFAKITIFSVLFVLKSMESSVWSYAIHPILLLVESPNTILLSWSSAANICTPSIPSPVIAKEYAESTVPVPPLFIWSFVSGVVVPIPKYPALSSK